MMRGQQNKTVRLNIKKSENDKTYKHNQIQATIPKWADQELVG